MVLFQQIGDYLLTLPQQIEPFTSVEDPAFSAAMTNTQLPYITNEKGMLNFIALFLINNADFFTLQMFIDTENFLELLIYEQFIYLLMQNLLSAKLLVFYTNFYRNCKFPKIICI